MPEPVSAVAVATALAERHDNVITLAEARRCGMRSADLRALLRSGAWRRLHREVFLVDADLFEAVPPRSLLRAALKKHGERAVLWGASAAQVWGLAGVPPTNKVWVMLPIGEERPQEPAVRLRFREQHPDEICRVDGFPVTVLTRTLADLVADVDRLSGLSLLDSALHQDLISRAGLCQVVAQAAGRRGAVKVRELSTLADGRAATPLESRVRLRAIDGGAAPEELQWPVRDRSGQVVGIADLAWLRRRRRPLVGEADGEGPHSRLRPITHDRHRQNDFSGADVEILRFTWADTLRAPYVPATIRRSLNRAS